MNISSLLIHARRHTFLWQALLIVVPILVLATAGFLSLREDRHMARHEADERARALANEMTRSIWATLTNVPPAWADTSALRRFVPTATGPLPALYLAIKDSGELEFPPVLELREKDDRRAGVQALEARSGRDGGDSALALSHMASNLVCFPTTESSNLLARLSEIERQQAHRSPPKGGSGTVAAWEKLWQQHEMLRRFFDRLQEQFDLEAAGIESLPRAFWLETQEGEPESDWFARRFYEEPDIQWFVFEPMKPTHSWSFPMEQKSPDGFSYRGSNPVSRTGASSNAPPVEVVLTWHPKPPAAFLVGSVDPAVGGVSTALDEVSSTVRRYAEHLPGFLGISLDLAGKTLLSSNSLVAIVQSGASGGKGGPGWHKTRIGAPTETLAMAAVEDGSREMVRVAVHLTSPALLYARQQSRSFMFGSVIALAACTALLGLVTANRAFRRQQRLAEMKDNFVSSVSHELRAPIASVRLMAESLEHGGVTDQTKQHEYFQLIGQECRRLSSLIENVLDYSRIEQGRKEYVFEPTDLQVLATQTLQLMEPTARARGMHLQYTSMGSPLLAEVDGRAVQQALVNLIDNALKHSSPNSTVTVGLDFPDDPDRLPTEQLVRLWVEDTGEGIAPEEHERIFDRFYRCGSELRRTTEGVGIGLSIVQHIVNAHGGSVRVRSAVGQGSRFTLYLPIKVTTRDTTPVQEQAAG